MKKHSITKRDGFVFIGVFIVIIAIIYIAYYFTSARDSGVIKIGFIGALSDNSPTYGVAAKQAIELAVEEINQSGGIHGRQLEVIYKDGECEGPPALAATEKLVYEDNVLAIVGGTCSGAVLSVRHISERENVIIFSSSASSPELSNIGEYVFRNVPSDTLSGALLANMTYNVDIQPIIISEDTDDARALASVYKREYVKLGGQKPLSIIFSHNTTDFYPVVQQVLVASSSVVVVNPQYEDHGGMLIRQLRESGYAGKIYATTNIIGSSGISEAAGYADGIEIAGLPDLDVNNPKAASFKEAFINRYGSMEYQYFTGAAYDSLYIIADALRQSKPSRESIYIYLKNLRSYSGVIGTYGFDKNGDMTGVYYVKKIIKNGIAVVQIE